MKNRIDDYINDNFNKYLDVLKSTLAIRSVKDIPSEDAPFGLGPKLCLEHVLSIGKKMGFRTKNIENSIGYIEFGPEDNEKYLGIFGHLDVVDEGRGWDSNPYELTERDGLLYGRGVLDNKAPILSNLFALYVLKELGVEFKSKIRIVFGTNEETGMNDIPIYLKHEKPPYFGWTPDCKFPIVYGERGRAIIEIYSEEENKSLLDEWDRKYLDNINPVDAINIGFYDDDFGKLLLRNIKRDENKIVFTLSYPTLDMDQLINRINVTLNGLKLRVVSNVEPIIYDVKDYYVTKLGETLKTLVNFDTTPVTTTGGTYAKLVPHIVAYGPSFPGQNGIAHLPNEWVSKKDLLEWTIIYAHSIYSFKGE